MEATPGIEPGFTVLQTVASPLRHVAESSLPMRSHRMQERRAYIRSHVRLTTQGRRDAAEGHGAVPTALAWSKTRVETIFAIFSSQRHAPLARCKTNARRVSGSR